MKTRRLENSGLRLSWVDCCKGICILLVVYGHVTGGLEAAGDVAYGSAFDQIRNWVYLFHMPAFFFLSGLFAYKTLNRSSKTVLLGKVKTLFYPYVLWTGIYLMVQELMARYSNNPPEAGRALRLLWEPYGYGLWFLYSLFIISLLFYVIALARMPRIAVLVLALVLHEAAGANLFAFWPILNTALLNFIFYALSGLYFDKISAYLANGHSGYFLMISIFLLGLMTLLSQTLVNPTVPVGLTITLLGVCGVVCLANGLAGTMLERFLYVLGFYSLEIYLGHALFSTASRAILTRLGLHDAFLSIASGVFIGVAASVALALFCQKLGFSYLYRWPSAKRPVNSPFQPQT